MPRINLCFNHNGVEYSTSRLSRMLRISLSAARRRIKMVLSKQISPGDALLKKCSRLREKTTTQHVYNDRDELSEEQQKKIAGFYKITRNDDRLIDKYYREI